MEIHAKNDSQARVSREAESLMASAPSAPEPTSRSLIARNARPSGNLNVASLSHRATSRAADSLAPKTPSPNATPNPRSNKRKQPEPKLKTGTSSSPSPASAPTTRHGRVQRRPEAFDPQAELARERQLLAERAAAAPPTKKARLDGKKAVKKIYYNGVEIDGVLFRVGDAAYVVKDPTALSERGTFEEDEPCEVCGELPESGPGKEIMLECDTCLRGYHLVCVKKKTVPQGSWLCPCCSKGRPPKPRENPITARERFLHPTATVGLVQIEHLWSVVREDGRKEDSFNMECRWFLRPEDTHVGRQPYHNAREVFLSRRCTDTIPSDAMIRAAAVCGEETFRAKQHDGDDVFLCTSSYDESYRRFSPYTPEGGILGEAIESDSEGEGADFDAKEEARRRTRRKKRGPRKAAGFDPQISALFGERGEAVLGPVAAALPILDAEEEADAEFARRRGRVQGGREFLLLKRRVRGVRPIYMREEGAEGDADSSSEEDEEETEAGPSTASPATPLSPRSPGAAGPGPSRAPTRDLSKVPLAAKLKMMAKARESLLLSNVPGTMPCREGERKQVLDFALEFVKSGGASDPYLYVSGVPGTGKTATVHQVMRELRQRNKKGELGAFQFIEINALSLSTPNLAFSRLWEALTSERLAPEKAQANLERRFSAGGRGAGGAATPPVIVLLDEMDLLVTRRQSVLYSLLDWPLRQGAKLAVIGIANTMDLPERLLPKISSRLGALRRLQFLPYKSDQMVQVIRARLEDKLGRARADEVFQPQGLELAAKKVGAMSGDLRRVMELCKRGLELAEEAMKRQDEAARAAPAGGTPAAAAAAAAARSPISPPPVQRHLVAISSINKAAVEMFGATHRQLIDGLSRPGACFLAAVCQEAKWSGRNELVIEDVYTRLCSIVAGHGETEPTLQGMQWHASRLADCRILIAEPASRGRFQKLSLNVPQADVEMVLARREDIKWAAKMFGAV